MDWTNIIDDANKDFIYLSFPQTLQSRIEAEKNVIFFIQLKIIGDQGLGGNGKAASKKDLESEYKLWIRRNVNKGRMWGNNDILPLFRKWVVNILKTSTCNLNLERLSQTTKETGSRVWAYLGKKNNGVFFFNLGSLPHHLNLSPITIGSHSPVWIR